MLKNRENRRKMLIYYDFLLISGIFKRYHFFAYFGGLGIVFSHNFLCRLSESSSFVVQVYEALNIEG